MRSKWIRKMAIALSLCLFLNSGLFDLAGYVYAATGDSASSSQSMEVDASSQEASDQTTPTQNTTTQITSTSDQTTSTSDQTTTTNSDLTEDNTNTSNTTNTSENTTSTEESTTNTEESITSTEESTTNTEESITGTEESTTNTEESTTQTEESTTSTEESTTSTEESTTRTEENTTSTEESTTSTEESTTSTEESTEEIIEEGTTEESTEDLEVVDILEDGTKVLADGTWILPDGTKILSDGTQILPDGTIIEAVNVMALSEEDSDNPSDVNEYNLPNTVEEYIALKEAGDAKTKYYIQTAADFLKIQTFCENEAVEGFKGVEFIVLTESGSTDKTWKTSAMSGFTGIGTPEYPFQGSFRCYFENGKGVFFNLDKPLFTWLGDDASISTLDIVASGCSSPIAENIDGTNITITDIEIHGPYDSEAEVYTQGTIGSGSETEAAGTIAGKVHEGSRIMVSDVNSNCNINGASAGAIVGVLGSDVEIAISDDVFVQYNSDAVEVAGSYAAGGLFGAVYGDYTIDLPTYSNVLTKVAGTGSEARIGQLVGLVDGQYKEDGITLTIQNGSETTAEITAEVSGTALCGGGVVGACAGNGIIVLPEGGITVSGSVVLASGSAGGVVGAIYNSDMELTNCTVSVANEAEYVGGIVGQIWRSNAIIASPTLTGSVSGSVCTGGVIGVATDVSAVELQGIVNVQNATFSGDGSKGSVVGTQDKSLIYLSGVQGVINGEKQLKVPMVANDVLTQYNDISNPGGVYRNQDMDSSDDVRLLIGDGTLAGVGVIHNTIPYEGGSYQLGTGSKIDSTADLETLTIVQFTDGAFGLDAFTEEENRESLLSKSYVLNKNADISYDTTGIMTIDRHDKCGDASYAFSGEMKGVSSDITITQNTKIRSKWYMGVFSCLAGNTKFSNLIIDGAVRVSTNVGGLAYQTIGNSLTLEDIQMKKTYSEIYGSLGGVLAKENCNSDFKLIANDVVLASVINKNCVYNDDETKTDYVGGFIAYMDNADVELEDITLGGSMNLSGSIVGGFLGQKWKRTAGNVKNITVETGTSYTTNSVFGGLLHTATNQDGGSRLTLDNIDLANLTVNMGGQGACSLLINNGQQLVLEVIDYNTAGVTVNNASADFDEVVAINYVDSLDRKLFGVVSLHQSGKTFPEYHYEYQASYNDSVVRINPKTRYYYDLFQHIDTEDADGNRVNAVTIANNGGYVISNEKEFLLWDVVQCALKCESRVTDTFKGYFADNTMPDNSGEKYYFQDADGNLDLSGYSIYPIPRQYNCEYIGRDDVIITFGAGSAPADINTPQSGGMAGWVISNEKASQHEQLHAGLFHTTNGMITVKDIMLAGTIAGNSSYRLCGALVAGQLSAGGVFENITLKNLSINQYNGSGASLLIGHIPSGTVSFDGIYMEDYKIADYASTKAAGSLIYAAGGEDVTDLVLKFHNMKIEDDREAKGADQEGTVLKYSSFIYKYNYTDDASINEGSGLYLFSDADEAAGVVTYGAELDFETEYSNNSNLVFTAGTAPCTGSLTPTDLFIPYIYKESDKDIDVNPKSGDILKGCGTYEDPYIIETTKQFLTLYRYMNEPEKEAGADYQYQDFYENWKVIAIGDDSTFCSTKHSVKLATGEEGEGVNVESIGGLQLTGNGLGDVKVFGDAKFPTPEQLSCAYYQLGADIDLSTITNTTYKTIAADFVGFGTLERPFTGVWYGKDVNGIQHTVTLPDKSSTASYSTYGFIQYAQGAVVKDIKIITSFDTTVFYDNKKTARVSNAGGLVIACILGGDNIIDNVMVSAQLLANNSNVAIGGYVGNVKKGGLILRNIQDTALQNFEIVLGNGAELSTFNYLGAVVGKVEDGYVLYEGNSSSEYYYAGNGGNTTYEVIPNYTILNGDKLKDDASGLTVQKAAVDGSTTEYNITVSIPTAAALQVMSMAMNADALNVCPSDYQSGLNLTWGYSEKSRSRKAAYDAIGACGTTFANAPEDYTRAAAYDNVMGYVEGEYSADNAFAFPYLYQYMGITGKNYLTFVNGNYSVMNPAEAINEKNYHIYWNLAEGISYDMSVFDNGNDADSSFRGIGALYQTGEGYGATFRGDFDGNNSTIMLAINRDLIGPEANNYEYFSVKRAGLFNAFYAPTSDTETKGIYNHLSEDYNYGGLNETIKRPCYVIKDVCLSGSIIATTSTDDGRIYAGGVAAEIITGNFVFENISISDSTPLTIGTTNQTKINRFGGIVGRIGEEWNKKDSYVLIQNCDFGNETNQIVFKGYAYGGGFVGESSAKVLKIQDCKVLNFAINSSIWNSAVGGFVGYSNQSANQVIILDSSVEELYMTKADPMSIQTQNAGGFIGYANNTYGSTIIVGTETNIENLDDLENAQNVIYVKNSIIKGKNRAGCIVGNANCTITIQNVLCESNIVGSYQHMGGIAGELTGNLTSSITGIKVKNLCTEEINLCDTTETGMGGIVGKSSHTLAIKNAKVTGDKTENRYQSKIQSYREGNKGKSRTGSSGAGGIIGWQQSKTVTLTDCKVENVYIATNVGYNSGYEKVEICAGGIIGYAGSQIRLDGVNQVSGVTVDVPLYSEVPEITVMAAGGCFGIVKNVICDVASTDPIETSGIVYYNGLIASDNIVEGRNAGGIAGYVDGANTRLQGVKVKNGEVKSDRNAGGIYGYVMPSSQGLAFNPLHTNAETVEEYRNIVSDMKISGMTAGGMFGYALVAQNRMRVENITVENSEISAAKYHTTYSAGGLIGELDYGNAYKNDFSVYGVTLDANSIVCENNGTTISADKIIYPAVGGLVGRTYANSKAGEFFCDGLVMNTNNQIGIRNSAAGAMDTSVKLLKFNGSEYELTDVVLPESLQSDEVLVEGKDTGFYNYDAVNSLVSDYGYCVGTMIGVNESTLVEFYIWRSKDEGNLFETPVMSTNPPVTDVGRNEDVELIEGNSKYFRNNAHIVYGAPVTEITDEEGKFYKASDASKNLAHMNKCVNETNTEYSKSTIENFASLLQNYRLSEEDVNIFTKSYQKTYTYPGTSYTIDEPILVLKAENGTVQELMETLTDIMTNMAGASASDISENRLEITTQQKVVTQSRVTMGSGEASIKASIEDSVVTYESPRYDGLTEAGMTYTEITFTYGMADPQHQKVFRLPVYVEEPILYGSHMKIMEGRVTSVEEIREDGILASDVDINMANDSDYTLLLEYTYGKARTNMPDNVVTDKIFYQTNGDGSAKPFAKGTCLLLIDVNNGNIPYYYTVETDTVTKVKFTDFKDSAGNYYKNKPINELETVGEEVTDESGTTELVYTDMADHELTQTGVEQFLLTVLSEDESSEVYNIHADMIPTVTTTSDESGSGDSDTTKNSGIESQFTPLDKEHTANQKQPVIAIPGLVISLNKTDGNTKISGEISKDGLLTIKATFSLTGADAYWAYRISNADMIDSENNGKYLELGFYLRDENGNRVSLPDGTNFSYIIDGVDSDNKIIEDNSIVYYYKDIRELFEKLDAVYQISDIKENTNVTVEFNLNFAGADLSSLTNDKYVAWIDLLRTANKDYPMGNGNTLDSYSEDITATAVNKLGFAIKADDINSLAINTYPSADELNEIPYQTMFDFSAILDRISGEGKDASLEKWAGFDYEVTYQLWKKTENGENVTYERYMGKDKEDGSDSIVISVPVNDSNKGVEEIKVSSGGSVTVTYQFDSSEIENGSVIEGANQQAGLIIRDGQLTIATADLVSASQDNLTNYKIIASLIIKEGTQMNSESSSLGEETIAEDAATQKNAELITKDFFIFTVTKLKTDLSQ